jgi:hypothetical protein
MCYPNPIWQKLHGYCTCGDVSIEPINSLRRSPEHGHKSKPVHYPTTTVVIHRHVQVHNIDSGFVDIGNACGY